ncbi:uncharacterized protein BDZ99DRAFT_566595 [Mytilinidion resinicola]|uniref:Uncharacterized protein n=1 Tax=Mytilinidion resinicola TaxID=574789 RepID=A0A6A6Z399_9PEZI|nr:uncharacterized protein BDZ99DRAFT_566595 [Mytilinidion resinicola]KAF2814635.1 hypothetical protein BDZ99DRAFT_566595 [Mytilinidion resinicola]
MPTDRHHANNTRPLMPTLASNRTAKTPKTPRLAPSSASAQSNASQTRRPDRSDAPGYTPRDTVPRDDLSTPVKAFLNNNITPRSSSRKSRVGTNSTQSTPSGTPSGTPTTSRPVSTTGGLDTRGQGNALNGLGIYGSSGCRPKNLVNGGSGPQNGALARSPASYGSDSSGPRENSPMFFHALDSRLQDSNPAQKKSAAFFYANGIEDERSPRLSRGPSPPLSAIERARSQPQSDIKSHSPILTPPLTTVPEATSYPNPAHNLPSLRPPSPSKESIHLSYRKGASQVIRPSISQRPSELSILPAHSYLGSPGVRESDNERASRRRSSAESSSVRIGHAKSASLSSIDSGTPIKKAFQAHIDSGSSPSPSPLQREAGSVSNGSRPDNMVSGSTPPREDLSGFPLSLPQSPTKSNLGQSALQHMNELAANARRERKVLDLEISNSSLLAINRQLEREVRRQKAELRRFRRLSRAGRFSSDTNRSSLGELSTIADDDSDACSDTQEQDLVEEHEHNEEDTSDSSFDEEALSPTALADRDAYYREKDEKRLQLDLSRHRELLVDSQKMNQSLKRCLGWTEELINEGKKALEYKVRVSDVKLGGRVLSSEEQAQTEAGEDIVQGGTLLSAWTLPDRSVSVSDRVSMSSSRTDRDSGVELEGSNQTGDYGYNNQGDVSANSEAALDHGH